MNIKALEQFKQLCKIIGLETLEHVRLFKSKEQRQNEQFIDTLTRYAKELKK